MTAHAIHPAPVVSGNPFDLWDDSAYGQWRACKLAGAADSIDALVVRIADPYALTQTEHAAVLDRVRRTNLAIYELGPEPAEKSAIRALGQQFGLQRLDGNLYADEDDITSLRVSAGGRQQDYIPYTNRRLSWHTDGYYNAPDRQIRGIVMHCVQQAASGGDSLLLDHELAYILLRDTNPDWIAALMAPDVLTIPANIEGGSEIRPAVTGPVFSVDAQGALHMRYSARTRNIVWKQDRLTQAAVKFLQSLWESGSPYIYRHRLLPGQGIICNNTLHCRSGFQDGAAANQERLLYRARYYDRIAGTGLRDIYPDQSPGSAQTPG